MKKCCTFSKYLLIACCVQSTVLGTISIVLWFASDNVDQQSVNTPFPFSLDWVTFQCLPSGSKRRASLSPSVCKVAVIWRKPSASHETASPFLPLGKSGLACQLTLTDSPSIGIECYVAGRSREWLGSRKVIQVENIHKTGDCSFTAQAGVAGEVGGCCREGGWVLYVWSLGKGGRVLCGGTAYLPRFHLKIENKEQSRGGNCVRFPGSNINNYVMWTILSEICNVHSEWMNSNYFAFVMWCWKIGAFAMSVIRFFSLVFLFKGCLLSKS